MFDDLKQYSYQLALFVGSGSIRPDELSYLCRRELKIGEFEPMLMPDVPGLPDEVPRLQLQTDRGYRLTMSRARIDFFLDVPLGLETAEVSEFKENYKLLLGLLERAGLRYSRLGFLRNYLKVVSEPGKKLAAMLGGFGSESIADFSVSATEKVTINRWACNNIFQIASGIIRGVDHGIVVGRDINTLPEVAQHFSLEDANKFADEADRIAGVDSIVRFVGMRDAV